MKTFEKKIEAVCDCRASVSCLSPLIYDELKRTHKLDLKACLRKLRAANGVSIEVKGVVRVPVIIGPKTYEHDFCVLKKSEADFSPSLDFLETINTDPFFCCMEVQLDSTALFRCITNSSITALITFFESFWLRHSQFHLVTRESFLPT